MYPKKNTQFKKEEKVTKAGEKEKMISQNLWINVFFLCSYFYFFSIILYKSRHMYDTEDDLPNGVFLSYCTKYEKMKNFRENFFNIY